MADSIYDKFRKLEKASTVSSGNSETIFDKFRVPVNDKIIPPPENPLRFQSVEQGLKQGVVDVGNTLNSATDYITDTIQDRGRYEQTNKNIRIQNKQYEEKFGDNAGANVGRLGGQVLSTAPFVPGGMIARGLGALPTITTAGETIAAPLVNRLGAIMTTGAAGGASYGAGINSTNEEGLGSNVGTNAAMGVVGAPIIAGAGKLGSGVIPAVRSLKANLQVLNAARNAGLPASAIKATVRHLEETGMTSSEAIQELNRLGSRATLGDIDPALQARVSGLSQLGGKPTSILRTRYGDRADTADNAAKLFVANKLGPKPDIEAEGDAIYQMAKRLAGPSYKIAHASPDKLDTSSLISHIDDELKNAVGSRAAILKEIKGYLFNSVKAADGTITKTPKDTIAQLHPIREEIDDIINKRGEGLSPNTFGKVSTVRGKLDDILKTNSHMQAADEEFAKHMNVKSGLQIGYDAITKKTNKDEFVKLFDKASPELQNTIRKGIHAAIVDSMEGASAGQEAATRRLFNKKEINKEILRKVFGTTGEDILDTVHSEVAQRETERLAKYGSQTALNTAIREEYKGKGGPHLGDISFGAAMDALGAGGAGVGATMLKRGLTNRVMKFSDNRLGQLTEGTADLLSRQGSERDIGMQVIDQVSRIQNRLKTNSSAENLIDRLPRIRTLAAPFGGKTYDQVKEKVQ